MSGGRFRYDNDTLCREVFNWSLNPEYGLGKHPDYMTSVKAARRINPMKDREISRKDEPWPCTQRCPCRVRGW